MYYHKIDTLFERNDHFKVDTTKLRRPEFGLIKEWYIEEKIDGMSVGFKYFKYAEDWKPLIFGRTANTNWNAKNKEFMNVQWEKMFSAANEIVEEYGLGSLTIYGELYGPGIQNGGGYRDDLGFICFDMAVNTNHHFQPPDTWLNVTDRNKNAERMGVDVPWTYLEFPIPADNIILYIKQNELYSVLASKNKKTKLKAEGVIARPPVNLYDQRGARVMWKLKGKDF